MNEIFRRIVEKYEGHYDECCMTSEKLLEILHKMRANDRLNVVAASRSSFLGLDDNSYFTVKEWILSRKDFIEHEIDCIFKYYSQFVTPELMDVLEDILKSAMHTHLTGVLFQCPNNISFEGCNVDEFFYPYFELMKKLESLQEQYQ